MSYNQERHELRMHRARLVVRIASRFPGITFETVWDYLDRRGYVQTVSKESYRGNISKDGIAIRDGSLYPRGTNAPKRGIKPKKRIKPEYKPTLLDIIYNGATKTMRNINRTFAEGAEG